MKWIALLFAGLLSIMACSGVKTAYYAHEHAALVAQVQTLKQQRDRLNDNWTQLLLEQKTLANDTMIGHAVAVDLDLHIPTAVQVVYLD